MLARALPAVIAVVLVGVLGSDVAVAANLRAQDRAAAAAAAERRAVGVYRDKVRPIAERVYDEIQPLQDAVDSYEKPGPDAAQIAGDVLSHSGVQQAVLAQRTALARMTAPASLRGQRGRLLTALDSLAATAGWLSSKQTQAFDTDFKAASATLGSGILAWSASLISVYGEKAVPSRPVAHGALLTQRAAASRASLIAELDHVCSAAFDADAALPAGDTPQQFVKAAPRYTKLFRSTVRGLSVAKVPPSQKARVAHDIAPNFARADKLADGIDAVLAAAATGNPASIRRGLDTMLVGMRGSQALAVSLRRYGATVCANFFEIPAADIRAAESHSGGVAV